MKAALFVAMASAGIACAAGPRSAVAPPRTPHDGPGTERALPIPADLAPFVKESIDLGRTLYFLDKASSIGTDVVRENGRRESARRRTDKRRPPRRGRPPHL
jgi:hypothetical protein